ncbi:MAG TPA: glycosyltransferase [Dehalococcoidia bacterium]|nr:glycosyltransferase [Dehalococcoidia bacterium]
MQGWQTVDPVPTAESYDAPYLLRYAGTIRRLASHLAGIEVVHVNSTASGGGVAEILTSLIPLSRWYLLDTRWLVIPPDPGFFAVTRKVHDLLQGAPGELTDEEWQTYISHVHAAGAPLAWDGRPRVWFLHDHQMLPLVELLPKTDRKIWVSHVDTSEPNPTVIERLLPLIHEFDAAVFTLPQYVPAGLDRRNTPPAICPPAIDPLRRKNHLLPEADALDYVRRFKIDPANPLIAQISRFDPWKDPIGVIDAYRLAREAVPGLQLALVGALAAADDAKAVETLKAVHNHAGYDHCIHIYWDATQIDDDFVMAFQTAPQVILQKSIREGYGLTVTEAMWKAKAVIGGNAGGIAEQIRDGYNGYLVDDVEQCAQRIVELLRDAALRRRLGEHAHEDAEEHGLMPRLLCDYLEVAHGGS